MGPSWSLGATWEPTEGQTATPEAASQRGERGEGPLAGRTPAHPAVLVSSVSLPGAPGSHGVPSSASVSLSITFNTLTVTVYNVSIRQNRSVNSGPAEQQLRKINNSIAGLAAADPDRRGTGGGRKDPFPPLSRPGQASERWVCPFACHLELPTLLLAPRNLSARPTVFYLWIRVWRLASLSGEKLRSGEDGGQPLAPRSR